MESEFKVSAWANEIVLSQYSSLSREQTEEIWHEFNVWATTRVIRKAQAKRKGFDKTVKTLLLHGDANNLQEAYCKAMQFIWDRSAKYFLHIFRGMLPGAATSIVADCLADPLKP